jgi:hypothetical protein
MKFSPRSLPHPVLNNGDDIVGFGFQTNFEVAVDKQNYYLKVSFDLSHPGLLALIQEQQAQYVVHVECGASFYRKRFSLSESSDTIKIGADFLRDRVEVNFFICAIAPLSAYLPKGAHPDYGSTSFTIRKGDILATAEGRTFDAEKDYDALKKVSSIMIIRESPTLDAGPFVVDFTRERIEIILSKEDYRAYSLLKTNPKLAAALTGTIVLPVLLDAINCVESGKEADLEGCRWFRNLENRLEDLKNEGSNLVKAQKLLEQPLQRTLANLREFAQNATSDD